jgi:TPP-dependent 2-oxoacid decarboxylase
VIYETELKNDNKKKNIIVNNNIKEKKIENNSNIEIIASVFIKNYHLDKNYKKEYEKIYFSKKVIKIQKSFFNLYFLIKF